MVDGGVSHDQMDSWFSLEENFDFITGKGRYFVAALKDNRLLALSEEDSNNKRFTRVDELIQAPCALSQAAYQRIAHRLRPASAVQGNCAISVRKSYFPNIGSIRL